jgi:hypothetical protein
MMPNKKIKFVESNFGKLDIYNINYWLGYYSMYLNGDLNSIVEVANYLGLSIKVIRGVFDRFEFNKISISETTKRCLIKGKTTKLSKYGDCNYNNRNKAYKTNIDKFGTKHPTQNESVKDKLKDNHHTKGDKYKTNVYSETLKRWSIDYLQPNNYVLLDEFKGIIERDIKGEYIKYKIYNFKHNDCNNIFKGYFCGYQIKCPYCMDKSKSVMEKYYLEFVRDIHKITESGIRILGSGERKYEIDIFIPELNIGFEYNGLRYHSLKFVDKYYHKRKTALGLVKNIKLYHIWEHDNEEIVKSLIMTKLNKTENKYFARKLTLKEVKTKERREFFNTNHLHGDVNSKFSLGVYSNNELISCISYRQHKEGIEIARFATKLNSSCVGGFSKLLKHSISKLKELNYSKIITYCDRDWTPDYRDSVYFKNGFKFIKDTGCSLSYFNNKQVITITRETFQKHKLKSLFPETYDDNLTADEILEKNNIYPIYNSGNWKYELEI